MIRYCQQRTVATRAKMQDTSVMSYLGELTDLRVAIVHDELTRRGGAEAVLEELIRMLPQADVYALYAGRPRITVDNTTYPVHTTFLQRLPRWFRRHPARVLGFLPYAAEQIDLSNYDLVLSSASAFAKGVVTRSNVPHVSYCHTPTRYAWDTSHQVLARTPRWQRPFGKLLLHFIRLSDYAAAQRVDHFIANSQWTSERIATYYHNHDSPVVYPPIDTAFFTPSPSKPPRRSGFVCVGRLTPSKQFDQAITVCEKLGLPLTIVGTGHDTRRLEKLAGPNTQFVGKVDREQLRELYRGAQALIQPGEEDFGMATAEALACGTPVIAYGVGGAAEVVRHNETGILYKQPTVEALAEALRNFLAEPQKFPSGILQQSVMRFSVRQFRRGIERELVNAITAD